MKFTLSWIKQFLDTGATADEMGHALNSIGFEVEEVVDKAKLYTPFTIAEITEATRHPDAEKLSICTVNTGSGNLQVVCGAANARAGIKVVLAPVGSIIPANNMQIRASKIRGVESNGMLCSAEELMLEGDADGIIELGMDANVGQKFADYANLNDVVFDIDITPNRGDATSVYGIARDLAAKGIGTLTPLPETEISQNTGQAPISVQIEDKENCHAFVATYISGVNNINKSPDYTNQLRSIGSSLKTPLVDISNYAMMSLGRPNHIYDADKIKGTVVVRKSAPGERFIAIGGEEFELPEGLMVIADNEKVLCVAGVMGGELSKVTETTTNILVEVAEFDPVAVTTSGRALNLHSDSRFRFERRIDHGLTSYFTNWLNHLIVSACGGEIKNVSLIQGNKTNLTSEVAFRFDTIKSLGGVDIPNRTSVAILERLGFDIKVNRVVVPTWRQGTMECEADIVEEVLRIYGFDFIPSAELPILQPTAAMLQTDYENRIRQTLLARSLNEVVTWSFKDEKIATKFGHEKHVKITNPISIELNVMRKTVVANLLGVIQKNEARGYTDLGFFELGAIYGEEFQDKQIHVATGVRAGRANPRSVHKDERFYNFHDAKADFYAAIEAYGFDGAKLATSRNTPIYYHPGRSAAFMLGKNLIGFCGELHPSICKHFDISNAVAFELFYPRLPQPKPAGKKPKLDISDYQTVVRDFAFVLSDTIMASDFTKALIAADNMIVSAHVFDVYAGKGVDEGMKSVGVTIRIQPKDRTLSEEEINNISQKIVQIAEEKFDAKLR